MGKALKRASKGATHLRLVSAQRRAKTAELSERRHAETAARLATRLATDMVRSQAKAPAKGRKGARRARLAEADPAAADLMTPAPAGLTADVTDEMLSSAQTFGDVLESFGNAIVTSEAAFIESFVESAKQLSQTKLEVPVAVRQDLDDDGNLSGDPTVDTRTLSLSTLILPTLLEVKHGALSMDLVVSELDMTTGIHVKSGGASASFTKAGVGFSAAAAFNYSSVDAESRFKADFATGAIRLDTLFGPSAAARVPDINDYAIGPQILVTQAATAGPASAGPPATPAFRKVTLTVKLLDRFGNEITGKSVDVRLPAELRRRLNNWTTGAVPTASPIVIDLAPAFVAQPAQNYTVDLRYGDVSKIFDVTV